jgi:hypothetical protein
MWAALGAAAVQGVKSRSDENAAKASSGKGIHIAPIGVNLGAILQPFNEGAPQNGGFGLEYLSRYQGASTTPRTTITPSEKAPVFNFPMVCMAGGGCLVVYFLLK